MRVPLFLVTFVLTGASLVVAVALGCAPAAIGSSVKSGESAEVRQWQTRIAAIRGELETLAASAKPASPERLRELAGELETLERQLAGATVVTAAKPVADPPPGEPLRPVIPNHPFAPAIGRAKKALAKFDAIKDYTAVVAKRERMWDGKLNDYEYMYCKIRHEPFSVYLRFLGPENLRGREVIYVAGRNDGNLLAHEPKGGIKGFLANRFLKTIALAPTSGLAMVGNRYPITEIGTKNLTRKLIEEGEKDMRFAGADAKFYPNARVNGRPCDGYVFLHPVQDERFKFHRAEVFIDKELEVPIRYKSYGWPAAGEKVPPLGEEYTYTHLKLNVGLTDADFDPKNTKYEFPQ